MAIRNILLLVVGVIVLAIVRNLLREIGRIASRAMGGAGKGSHERGSASTGKLARDPQTGTYVDPAHAVRATVNGTVHFFESESSRDEYLRANA